MMNSFVFQDWLAFLWLLGLLPLLFVVFRTNCWRKSLPLITPSIFLQKKRSTNLLVIALLLAVLALARPGNHPQLQEVFGSGRDVVFLLDVSKSMLAEDVLPSRLARAKMAINSTLETLGLNDRVALVLFSGSASVVSPLTSDFEFFRKSVDEASRHSVSLGGTNLSEALLKCTEKVFTEESLGGIDVIVLTDGEDQDSKLDLAVEALNKIETQLILVGFGDTRLGSRIKQKNGSFLVEEGEEVWTKMQSGVLRELAQKCHNGVFLEVGTKNLDLGRVYQQIVKHHSKKSASKGTQFHYTELYQIVLFISTILILVSLFYSVWKLPKSRMPLVVLLGLFSTLLNAAEADGSDSSLAELEKKVQNMTKYIVASRVKVDPEVLKTLSAREAYNQGCDQVNKKNYFKALIYFKWAKKSKFSKSDEFAIGYNIGTCYYEMARLAEKFGVLKEALSNIKKALIAYKTLFQAYPHHSKLLYALEASYLYQDELKQLAGKESQQSAKSQGEDDDSASDDEGDEESDSQDEGESSDKMESGQPSDQSPQQQESLKSPEQILQEEIENNAKRQQEEDDGKPMKNDW
jgi:tetratricopeptide (TPR) repeat protein